MLTAPLTLLALAAGADTVEVHASITGCFHHEESTTVWKLDGGTWRDGKRTLAPERLEAIRRTVLDAPAEIPDLLATLGVTPASVAAHRDAILAAASSATWTGDGLPPLTPALEELLTYGSIAPCVERELREPNLSTTTSRIEVALPGDPPIRLVSESIVPWALPWTITAGERTWTTPDVRVSRAVLELADPDGAGLGFLDGAAYWRDGFWKDEMFWTLCIGDALDTALSEQEYARLPGFEEANRRFRVEKVMTGSINMHPESMFFALATRTPTLIDAARWYDPIVEGEPSLGWDVFARTFAKALEAAQPHAWLAEWKRAAPGRSIRLEAFADQAHGNRMLDELVTPAWRDAGFAGEPEIQLVLGTAPNDWPVTVYLSSREPRALIAKARAPKREPESAHWLDGLAVSFHPKDPRYAVATRDGAHEVRQIEE
jgi:hypothetical protein